MLLLQVPLTQLEMCGEVEASQAVGRDARVNSIEVDIPRTVCWGSNTVEFGQRVVCPKGITYEVCIIITVFEPCVMQVPVNVILAQPNQPGQLLHGIVGVNPPGATG